MLSPDHRDESADPGKIVHKMQLGGEHGKICNSQRAPQRSELVEAAASGVAFRRRRADWNHCLWRPVAQSVLVREAAKSLTPLPSSLTVSMHIESI